MFTRKSKFRTIINLPSGYLNVIGLGNILFPSLYQLENGLRIAINKFLAACYGPDWWELKLKNELKDIYDYAVEQEKKRQLTPWIGASKSVPVLPIHLVTLGHLEEIVKKYRSDCIPDLFPTLEFFLGHMYVIKRVRNLYTHMFPCIDANDCRIADREITTLSEHINAKL